MDSNDAGTVAHNHSPDHSHHHHTHTQGISDAVALIVVGALIVLVGLLIGVLVVDRRATPTCCSPQVIPLPPGEVPTTWPQPKGKPFGVVWIDDDDNGGISQGEGEANVPVTLNIIGSSGTPTPVTSGTSNTDGGFLLETDYDAGTFSIVASGCDSSPSTFQVTPDPNDPNPWQQFVSIECP